MQELNLPAMPFLFKLDAELRKSNFTVWRNISWTDGSEIPIFAFKNCWWIGSHSFSLFLKEVDKVSMDDFDLFMEDCFHYLQRKAPQSKKVLWARPYMYISVLAAEHITPEVIDFVCKKGAIRKQKGFSQTLAFPVLINFENKQIYYFRKKKLYGYFAYWLFQELVQRLIVQKLPWISD